MPGDNLNVGTGAGVVPAGGVAMTTPPEYVLPSITAAVNKAAQAIPAGRTGALVTVFTPRGANLAVVHKAGDHVTVTAWIGKSWEPKPGESSYDYGAALTASW